MTKSNIQWNNSAAGVAWRRRALAGQGTVKLERCLAHPTTEHYDWLAGEGEDFGQKGENKPDAQVLKEYKEIKKKLISDYIKKK